MADAPGSPSRSQLGLLKARRRINKPLLKTAKKRRTVRRDQTRKRQAQQALLWKFVQNKVVTQSNAAGTANYTAVGTFTLLNGLAPGVTETTRVGRKICITRIYHSSGLFIDLAGSSGIGRWMLVYDRAPNGTTPTTATLLESTTCLTQPMINHDNAWRFQVLAQDQFVLDGDSVNTRQTTVDIQDLDLTTIYNAGVAGTIADISTGALWLFRCCDSNVPTDTSSVSLYFYDA